MFSLTTEVILYFIYLFIFVIACVFMWQAMTIEKVYLVLGKRDLRLMTLRKFGKSVLS